MQLVPQQENPFSHHPVPLQTGRKLQATGNTQDAALAFEAAGMVSTLTLQHAHSHTHTASHLRPVGCQTFQ